MGTISPKGGVVRCYFGVSPRKIIIMDEKTKVQYCTKLCQSNINIVSTLVQHYSNIGQYLCSVGSFIRLLLALGSQRS